MSTRSHVRLLDQYLPCREGHHRQRGGLGHRHAGRLSRHLVLVDGDQLRERASGGLAQARVDLVPRGEAPDGRTHGRDHAGQVAAEHERRFEGQDQLELAGLDLAVDGVDPGRVDRDEDVVLAGDRGGQLPGSKWDVLAVLVDDEGLHDARKLSAWPTNCSWNWKIPPWPASG
jgi:hypothetical protein